MFSSKTTKILKLVVLTVAIGLIYTYNIESFENFGLQQDQNDQNGQQDQQVQGPSFYYRYPNIYGNSSVGTVSSNAPYIFREQLYPKTPWYPKEGQLCTTGCGATEHCSEGLCRRNPSNGTVFGNPVIYNFK